MTSKMLKLIFAFTLSAATVVAIAAPITPFSSQPAAANGTTGSKQAYIVPTPPSIDATGYVLMDANSGQILASKNPDQRMAPASLTKMMTSYIVSAALDAKRVKLDDLVLISEDAWRTGGSKMFVRVGNRVPVRDLMQGMIVDSGNDACVALSEFVAGSQDAFVNLMNQQAAILGMKGTHFMDVNGLPDAGHFTTPRDMALLARALVLDFPQDYQWYSQKWFTYNNIRQPNRNRLLWNDNSVDGIKTGHTDEAGFCLVASAQRKGTRLISVVMGAPSDNSRATDSGALLNYGFRFYASHKLYNANKALTSSRVWFGENSQTPIGTERDIYVTLPINQDAELKTAMDINNPLEAPIKKGQVLGNITISLGDKVLTTQPLIALADNGKGSWLKRLMDEAHLSLSRLI